MSKARKAPEDQVLPGFIVKDPLCASSRMDFFNSLSLGIHYVLSYRSVCHNSTFVLLLLIYQFILNLNLIVNILLRAFKSYLGKYSIVCNFYANKSFQYLCNFHIIHFAINQFLKFLNSNQLAIHFTIYLHQINLKHFNMQFKHFGDRDLK